MADDMKAPILQKENGTPSYGITNPTSSYDVEKMGESSPPPASQTKKPAEMKKKQPGFLSREILITNPSDVDKDNLLELMHKRFVKNYEKWKRRAMVFKFANLLVTIAVIAVQLTQVVLFQVPDLSMELKNAMATILPAITGAILAIQLKLAWSEKGAKCKKSAQLFSLLSNHTEYRMRMKESGGEPNDIDVVKLWNTALLTEAKDVPAFLLAY